MKAATPVADEATSYTTISIHAAREGGDCKAPASETAKAISIHAAREGGDGIGILGLFIDLISIHAAREGGDSVDRVCKNHGRLFQSTPPVKAATKFAPQRITPRKISIHAAREGGDPVMIALYNDVFISIHAAREGGDVCNDKTDINADIFQSTPPVKAATRDTATQPEADPAFQSTPPVKAATWLYAWNQYDYIISIHAAREGGDRGDTHDKHQRQDFNPRRP